MRPFIYYSRIYKLIKISDSEAQKSERFYFEETILNLIIRRHATFRHFQNTLSAVTCRINLDMHLNMSRKKQEKLTMNYCLYFLSFFALNIFFDQLHNKENFSKHASSNIQRRPTCRAVRVSRNFSRLFLLNVCFVFFFSVCYRFHIEKF